MSFISYAQNFEDVMLWRALSHIENGFYLDIGAQDPVIDSVSLAFYKHNWRGMHIEPTEQYASKLRKARPDEVVEQVAISNTEGALTFYEFPDTGLSTADVNIARKHKDAGFKFIETVVPVITLDTLFERISTRTIYWLKLDVEGLEKSVLQGWKESLVRPWILLIESTRPNTQEQNHFEWEPLVLSKGYEFAYFDGLNRFYILKEQGHLLNAFSVPPNIFDEFILSGLASHVFCKYVEERAQQAEFNAQQATNRLSAVYASLSWRITWPLRQFKERILMKNHHTFSVLHKLYHMLRNIYLTAKV